MTRLYLVRHGQTEWHSNGKRAGKADVPLDDTGCGQIRMVANSLQKAGIDYLYSSPRSRCIKMAEAVSEQTGLEVKSDERLQEMDIGNWDNEVYYPILQLGSELLKRFRVDPSQLSIPSGESFDLLRGRLEQWLEDVSDLSPDGSVAVISHSGPICVLIADVIGIPMSNAFRLRIDLASISILDCKGESSRLVMLNDISHLENEEM